MSSTRASRGRAGGPARCRRPARLWQRRRRALGQPVGRRAESRRHFVLHADGNWSKSDDLRTGGHIAHQGAARGGGRQPRSRKSRNSPTSRATCPTPPPRAGKLAGGLAYVDGAAQRRRVGHPPRRALRRADPLFARPRCRGRSADHRRQADPLRRARRNPACPASSARSALRGGYAKYRHDEIEDTGEIALDLPHNGGEGRAELVQTEQDGWGGTSGVQYLKRKVGIDGEEKFLPDSRQSQAGLFTLQTWCAGRCGSRAVRGSSSASWMPRRTRTSARRNSAAISPPSRARSARHMTLSPAGAPA